MTFDLEKARDAAKFDDHMAITMFPLAIAEIERLRGFETAARDLNNDLIRIAGERDELAARIQELEDALVEKQTALMPSTPRCYAEARRQAAIEQLRAEGKIGPDTEPANIQALQRVMRKQHDHPAEMVELNADHQYQPEAPRSWQITEERKAAIRDAEIALRDAVLDSNDPHCWDAETAVLRGMLEEVA